MCGRFDLTESLGHVAKAYDAAVPAGLEFKPRYNIAPSQDTPIILGGGDRDGRRLVSACFGMRPEWWSVPGRELINVREESLEEKPYFKRLLSAQRCVVPATGFFEWHHEGRRKTPFRFVARAGGLLSMAGLYLVHDFGFRQSYAFAVLTCPANEAMAPVHDRMPVLLAEEGVEAWLNAHAEPTSLTACLAPSAADYLRSYQVSALVNRPDHDTPAVIAPLNE